MLATAHGPQQYPRAGAQERQVAKHLEMSTTRAASDLAAMSPRPTVEKTVTAKYKASVRVSGSVKFAPEARSITKYVEANSNRLVGDD